MRPHDELVQELKRARRDCLVVLATDNMDCFYQRLDQIVDIGSAVDAVLCSSDLGLLKTDSIESFFGLWLKRHHLSFSNAVLLDDSESICAAFEAAGGTAIHVTGTADAIEKLRACRRTMQKS